MKNIIKSISEAKHIELVVEKDFLFVASALYTYILTLHKKVSLVCKSDDIGYKYAFLPWIEKVKRSDTPSADVTIRLSVTSKELYLLFKQEDIKINKKIAIALYAALVTDTDGFRNSRTDGMIFAMASELVKSGAEHSLVFKHLINHSSLGALRLKSIILQNMLLVDSAKVAILTISQEDLKVTGSTLDDAIKHMQEPFLLPYVEVVVLLDSTNEYEMIKIINKDK